MNLKDYFSKELIVFLSIAISIILVFSFALFGVTGVRIVFGLVMMWLPFYLILSKFELTMGERFVFSFILGLTLFTSITYLLGFLVSFRIAIGVTFLLLMGVFFLIRKYKK